MTRLRGQRRLHRRGGRSPVRRKRRNLVKFIPSADSDFALTAQHFAQHLRDRAEACGISAEDAAEVVEKVAAFREALRKTMQGVTRTTETVYRKNIARQQAEEVVRRLANIIRANPEVDRADKLVLRLKDRARRPRKRTCPQQSPMLRFRGSGDGVSRRAGTGGGSGVHVLECFNVEPGTGIVRRSKPDGASRLELFVDLIPIDETVPASPFDRVRCGRGWPWYLRSFTRTPIEVEFPLPARPMLVCYWGRWADATGEVGRFSRTCVARVEGWTPHALSLPESRLPADVFDAAGSEHAQAQVEAEAEAQVRIEDQALRPRLPESPCIIVHWPYVESPALPAAEARA